MFDDIRSDLRNQPRVSLVLISTAILVTTLLILEPNLQESFGVHNTLGVSILTRMTVPFCHGFTPATAVAHLVVNFILMYLVGTFLEKIIGGSRFLLITVISFVLYVLIHRLFHMIGNGFTPIIMTYAGVMLITLLEGRYVKTNTVFDDYYKLLWAVEWILWILAPVIFALIPIYFNSNYSLGERIFYGNVANVSCGILGIGLGFLFRPYIRKKLVQRTRKKYIKHERIDNYAWVFSFGFLIFLAIKLILD